MADPSNPYAKYLQPQQSDNPYAKYVTETAEPEPEGEPTSAGEAAKRGFFTGATFNFYDELKGLARAGGFDPDDPTTNNEIKSLFKGAYKYFSGDKEAEALYEAEKKRVDEETKRLEKAHPYASFGGAVTGTVPTALAMPVRALGMAGRIGQAALAGGVQGAISGAGSGEGPAGRTSGAAIGGGLGAGLGAVAQPVSEFVGGRIAEHAAPIYRTFRGAIAGETPEAQRAIGAAYLRDQPSGRGLTMPEYQAELAAGTPVANVDLGDTTMRGLARAAANTSPEARAALERSTQDRYLSTGERLGDWLRQRFHYPNADAQRVAIAEAGREANRPAYNRAFAEAAQAHPGGLWDEGFEQIAQAPEVQAAIRKASVTGASRAAREGFTPVGNPFRLDRTTGRMTLLDDAPRPTLQFWDQVKQNLDKVGTRDAQDWSRVLRERIDELVPTYGEARAGAASFFGARDMLNAGEQFVGGSKTYGIPATRRVLAGASEQERQLFQDGYASRLIEQLNSQGGAARTTWLRRLQQAPAAREELELGLGGRQAADEFMTRVRVEDVMDRMRGALGNSNTVRQLVELGMVGGGAGAYYGGGDLTHIGQGAGLALALRTGGGMIGRRVNERVSQRIGELLASPDPSHVERGIALVTRNSNLRRSFEAAHELLTSTGQATGARELPPFARQAVQP